MDINDQIAKTIGEKLNKQSQTGEFKVEARTGYNQYDLDSKSASSLVLVFKNQMIEDAPDKARDAIMNVLKELAPLKPHVKFETETAHMKRLADELAWFRAQEAALNEKTTGTRITTIPDSYPKWFEELPKRSGWNLKHALNVTKADTGVINIRIDTPKDVAPETIIKNFESRKAAIIETLADRAAKYTPNATPEEKEQIKAKIRKLDITFAAQSDNENKYVYIYVMSPEMTAATKQPGGITADKIKELAPTNPLLALQDGEDDQTPDKTKPQPHLKKALARSFLFAGENHIEVFPYIAGKEDMRRAVAKSLVSLKKRAIDNPTMVDAKLIEKIDLFMNDGVFKDQSQWNKPVEKQEDLPRSPRFSKATSGEAGKPYEKGVMEVTIDLPADKYQDIRQQLATGQSQNTEDLVKLADSLIAAGNALTNLTKNAIPAPASSWAKKEDIREASAPNLTLGA